MYEIDKCRSVKRRGVIFFLAGRPHITDYILYYTVHHLPKPFYE